MATATDEVKRGDKATLVYQVNGDLTGQTATLLARRRPGDSPLITKAGTVSGATPTGSTVTVELTPAETAVAGDWLIEIEAQPTGGGDPVTYPGNGYALLRVTPDLSLALDDIPLQGETIETALLGILTPALSAAYAPKLLAGRSVARVYTPEQYGAVGDGTADDTAPFLAAFANAHATRVAGTGGNIWQPRATVALRGSYYLPTLAAPVLVSCNVDGASATVQAPDAYANSVFLIGHETSGHALHNAEIRMPSVTRTMGAGSPVGSTGIRVQNLTHSELSLGRVFGFETGHHYTGLGLGTAYNRIFPGWIDLAKVAYRFAPGVGGWVNQNTFVGGGITQSPHLGVPDRASGYRHLLIDSPVYPVHNNTFIGSSFEGALSEFYFDVKGGVENTFYSPRFEQGAAGTAVVASGGGSPTLTAVGHGLTVGNQVVFIAVADPNPLVSGTNYYVQATPTANTFTVSATSGGAAINLTTTGTGVTYYRPPTLRWDNSAGTTYRNVLMNWNNWPGTPESIRTGGGAGSPNATIIG